MRCFDVQLKDYYCFLGDDNKNPTVSCYLPNNLNEMGRANDKRPSIVICPGGSYAYCSEREAEPVALNFLRLGFNAFVLNYSCTPHKYPTQLCEVAATFDLVCKNADEWNCDSEKIGIAGFSAGGHLAAHYSNAYSCDDVRKVFANSKKPAFSVLSYPVISADESFAHKGSFKNLVGEFPKDAKANQFSCEKLVSSDTPPTFIWHTAEDQVVPAKNSIVYAGALADNKVPFSLHIYPYGYHGISTCDELTNNKENLNDKIKITSNWLNDFKMWIETII